MTTPNGTMPAEMVINGITYRKPLPIEETLDRRLTAFAQTLAERQHEPGNDRSPEVVGAVNRLAGRIDTLTKLTAATPPAVPVSVVRRLDHMDDALGSLAAGLKAQSGAAIDGQRILEVMTGLAVQITELQNQMALVVSVLDAMTAPGAPVVSTPSTVSTPETAPEVQAPPTPFARTPRPSAAALLAEYLTTPGLTHGTMAARYGLSRTRIGQLLETGAQLTGQTEALQAHSERLRRREHRRSAPAGSPPAASTAAGPSASGA